MADAVPAAHALSVRGLTVRRGSRTVLEDVGLTAQPGQLTCLLGLPGAGKTSLLATLAGLLPPVRGAVFLGGSEISLRPGRRGGLALLPPGTVLPASRTLRAALLRLAGRAGQAEMDRRMELLGLTPLAGRQVGLLSHGEAALALTAARLSCPRLSGTSEVLLIDEVGEGLDAVSAARLMALLRTEAMGGRVLLSATRSYELALQADHLVLLAGGRVLQAGTPASLYAEPRDEASAQLTGPANILRGTVRELRPGSLVWAAASRHVQVALPEMARPVLGSTITLCLRPERLMLLTEARSAENVVEGTVLDVRSAGSVLVVSVETHLGVLRVTLPSWRASPGHDAGAVVRVGWAADAAVVLNPRE